MKVPWISKENIALKATDLIENFQALAKYEVKPPIPVEDIIERYLGLRLIYDDLTRVFGREVLGAVYVESRAICINERLFESSSEGRLVFTIAHEVGHWVLHRQYIEAQEKDGSRQIIVSKKGNSKETIEWQADYFASFLLMPEKEIREAFERVCAPEPLIVKNSMNEVGGGPGEPFVEQWPFIAAAMCEAGGFSNVSKHAMIIRLQDLGLLINKTKKKMDWEAVLGDEQERLQNMSSDCSPKTGCIDGDCANGQGKYVNSNGAVYHGQFENASPNGDGLLIFPDGSYYEGQWKDGQKHGKGEYVFANGNEYRGAFECGIIQGTGAFKSANGVQYDGEWLSGKFHGEGKMIFPDGGVYEGSFTKGHRNGEGRETSAQGNVYIGNWKDDLYHGEGTLIRADGTVYEGQWKNNKAHGHGTLTLPDGGVYKGGYNNGEFHAHGKMISPEGKVEYVGEWRHGKELKNS